jgi:ribonuclease E
LVINPTEALVSIDVNSGRSTKERNIEETAVKTNLEAADEVARQLRLRDLAGLVVIDFIDMDVNRNNSQVERRMKEALKHDRARIQVGRISPFGLLEMSRQRLRPSLIETSSEPCPHCGGTGIRRSTESTALVVLRAIDEEGGNRRAAELTVHVPTSVALYILNHKRDGLNELEAKHGMQVLLTNDDSLIPPDLRLERTKNVEGETISEMVANTRPDPADEASRKRRRRRRGRKRDDEGMELPYDAADAGDADLDDEDEDIVEAAETSAVPATTNTQSELGEDGKSKRRRRSRRGGRRRRKSIDGAVEANAEAVGEEAPAESADDDEAVVAETVSADDEASLGEGVEESADGVEKPKRRRSRRRRKPIESDASAEVTTDGLDADTADSAEGTEATTSQADGDEKPKRRRRPRRKVEATEGEDADVAAAAASAETTEESTDDVKPKPRRSRARKKPEDAEVAEKASVEVQAAPMPEAAPEPAPAPAPEPEPASAPVSHPAINTVIVGETPEKPKRKGWWNLGG